MPNTIAYRPILIDTLISTDRISSYTNVFRPSNDIELVGVYLWNTHVCGALYPLIASCEITLRNAIDSALTSHLGSFWWAKAKLPYSAPVGGLPLPKVVVDIRENFSYATMSYKREQAKRQGINVTRVAPTHNGVVAKTEFSTWEYMLNPDFMGPGLIWPARLGDVFKGPWPSTQASTVLRTSKDLVQTIRQFRNRISHHEPAWKKFGVRTEADAIQHLHEKIGKIEALLGLLNPEKLRLLRVNGFIDAAYRAASPDEIRRFQHLAKTHNIDSMRRLKALADTGKSGNKVLNVKISSGGHRQFLIVPK